MGGQVATALLTNSVVAILVLEFPEVGVVDDGVPVNVGVPASDAKVRAASPDFKYTASATSFVK